MLATTEKTKLIPFTGTRKRFMYLPPMKITNPYLPNLLLRMKKIWKNLNKNILVQKKPIWQIQNQIPGPLSLANPDPVHPSLTRSVDAVTPTIICMLTAPTMNVTDAIAMDTLLLIALGRPLNVISVKPVRNQDIYIRTAQKTAAINVDNMDTLEPSVLK